MLHDIHGEINDLKQQISYLEESNRIDMEVENACCPVCGGRIELMLFHGGYYQIRGQRSGNEGEHISRKQFSVL